MSIIEGKFTVLKRATESHSIQCDINLKINTALAHKYGEKIYFPQNVDFRGRVSNLLKFNHLGNDLSGLFKIFEQKATGEKRFPLAKGAYSKFVWV